MKKNQKPHTHIMKYQYSIQMAITKHSGITKSWKGCRDANHLHIAGRMQNNIAILENSWAVFKKLNTRCHQ